MMEMRLQWAGCTNHFDVKTGIRSARVEFVSGEMVMTGEGLQPHTRLVITVDGDTANTMQRLKGFAMILVPDLPPAETPAAPTANNGASPDLTAADVQGKDVVFTIGPSARRAAAAKAAEKPTGN
jgi:hypothetical protein